MRRRRRDHNSNHERWLVSYADFITLLFAFFVVLYASSRADIRKQAEVAQSIHSAFTALGIFPGSGHGNGAALAAVPPTAKASPTTEENLEHIRDDLQHKLAGEIAAHAIAMKLGPNGLVISLREAGFYRSGSAMPLRASLPVIGKIAQELLPTPYAIRIEGHTDNVPIHNSRYTSNWELSTARATYMTQLMITTFHLQPARLSAAGYAQYHPIASNATAAGRAKNRRVDIIVLPEGFTVPHFASATAVTPADKPSPVAAPTATTGKKPASAIATGASSRQKPSPYTPSAIASSKARKPSPDQ